MIVYLKSYIRSNAITFIVGIYFLFSSILKSLSDIDICIPCVFKTLFGIKCPGCGLTRAFIWLLELNFSKAFESNKLIFIVLPAGIYFLSTDYLKHMRKQKTLLTDVSIVDKTDRKTEK